MLQNRTGRDAVETVRRQSIQMPHVSDLGDVTIQSQSRRTALACPDDLWVDIDARDVVARQSRRNCQVRRWTSKVENVETAGGQVEGLVKPTIFPEAKPAKRERQ